MSETADRFRRVADGFTQTIAAVPDDAWDNPAPCEGWDARDVVRHLVEWLPGPGFLLGAFDSRPGPFLRSTTIPPACGPRFATRSRALSTIRPSRERVEDCGPPGRLSFEAAVEMTCTSDVLIHTWDLAQAAGIDVALDAEAVSGQAAGIESMPPGVDEAMRGSGHFGPRVDVPADADG